MVAGGACNPTNLIHSCTLAYYTCTDDSPLATGDHLAVELILNTKPNIEIKSISACTHAHMHTHTCTHTHTYTHTHAHIHVHTHTHMHTHIHTHKH